MSLILIILVVLILFGGFGYSQGWHSGPGFPAFGGGIGLIVLILIILLLMGRI